MRPRVFPAEDLSAWVPRVSVGARFNEAAGIPRGRLQRTSRSAPQPFGASMRPRVFPAEDQVWRGVHACSQCASMRPRVFPAEDEHSRGRQARVQIASMRPRVFPAEDSRFLSWPTCWRCFNEAAGIPRGRPVRRAGRLQQPCASMRPRVFPAEDPRSGCMPASPTGCFNEAAGIPRGRPRGRGRTERTSRCFNEAAGIPRGRRCTLEPCRPNTRRLQ